MKLMFTAGAYPGFIEHIASLLTLIRRDVIDHETVVYGISAGAIAQLLAILYSNGYISTSIIKKFADNFIEAMKTSEYTNTTKFCFDNLRFIRPYIPDDFYKTTRNCFVGVTTTNGFEWRSGFKSNYDYFDTLLCSCNLAIISTYNHETIDGYYSYNESRDLPADVMVLRATYPPPLCLMPITNKRYLNHLLSLGRENTKREIDRFSKTGQRSVTNITEPTQVDWISRHQKYRQVDPKWEKELREMFTP